jgi:GLPGLI family protein
MIVKKIIFLISVALTTLVHAQVGNAYYKKQLASSTDSINNKYMKEALKSLKNRQYKLAFNKTEAIYDEVKSLDINENQVVEAFVKGISEYSGEIYFNSLKKSVINKKELSGSIFLIEKDEINWVLSKDTLKIDSYICYKATTTRIITNSKGTYNLEVTAWYAPEISLPYGPDGYGGLPGLILQLNNNGTITSLKKIEFLSEDENIDINFSAKGKKVTEDEFNLIVSKLYANRKSKY